ncbi:hypothetical protein S100390_v1c10210 [Spiroplasma sp. NBRC 100390]|uniref:lipoprotein n=1 Tax=unclassified Spiroplasma TaxID=2637901 RepID=UPI0008928A81|nr:MULTISPECIES: lipoprotein [unclassified Spiroplasma]AOX44357.1 hypothetical protein STU14_v1c10210 [Spiroplasma sp. TU-14]APE13827.1 hypothetical protein S100390_v1c10210 [Spiroplasma sp. NBRC 100390]
MKKLLNLLGVFSLLTSGAITVVSCTPKTNNENGDGTEEINDGHKDVEILNKISEKVSTSFENLSFKEDIERNNPYMLVAYTRVSDSKKTYQLNDKDQDDLAIKNEFLTTFRAVFDNVNREIKNEYSNYYPNSEPVSFSENDVMIELNFIDIEKLIELSGLPNMDGLQAVAINFNVKYEVKFKDLVSDNKYYASFNMTTDLKKFNLVKGGALSYFNQNIIDFYNDKDQIDVTTGDFKTLYDNFNLDYKKDLTTIDNIYKKILTNFIQANENLKDMITYNKDKAFLESQTVLFNSDYDRGFYYNNGSNDIADASLLSKWVKDNNVEEAKPVDFVSLYIKSVVPKFAADSKLELGQFKFSLDYINIFGMTLSGYFNASNTDFISTVILTKDKLETKISNFANIIIAFLKYYKVNFKGGYHFNVSTNIWNNLVEKYLANKLTNYSLPVTLFKEFTSDKDVINQKLVDLDLVAFKQVTGWYSKEIDYDKNNNLFWFNGGGRDASFVFGSSNFYYMPFYYLWSSYRYDVVKR